VVSYRTGGTFGLGPRSGPLVCRRARWWSPCGPHTLYGIDVTAAQRHFFLWSVVGSLQSSLLPGCLHHTLEHVFVDRHEKTKVTTGRLAPDETCGNEKRMRRGTAGFRSDGHHQDISYQAYLLQRAHNSVHLLCFLFPFPLRMSGHKLNSRHR
jgi:hypothetical protein